jgi:hypothetical protein
LTLVPMTFFARIADVCPLAVAMLPPAIGRQTIYEP